MGRVVKKTVYIDEDTWGALLALGSPQQASASSLCVVAAEDLLAAGERRQRDVVRRAAERTRERFARGS